MEIPTTETGSQVRPATTSTPWTMTPKRARMPAAVGSVADSTELQHWRSPVEQELAGVEVGCAGIETVEVATARRGRTARAAARVNFIVSTRKSEVG